MSAPRVDLGKLAFLEASNGELRRALRAMRLRAVQTGAGEWCVAGEKADEPVAVGLTEEQARALSSWSEARTRRWTG